MQTQPQTYARSEAVLDEQDDLVSTASGPHLRPMCPVARSILDEVVRARRDWELRQRSLSQPKKYSDQ